MRILKLTFILCLLSFASFSQVDSKRNQIDISGSYFKNDVSRFTIIIGGASADDGMGYCFGINYSRKIANKSWINTGIGYLKTSNDFIPSIGLSYPIVNIESKLLRIPVKIRYDIIKWFYIKTGLSFDYQFNNKSGMYISNQSGIGYSASIGINLNLFELIYFNIEPEIGFTSLIPLNFERYYQQHFLISGVNFSIGIRL